jgi:hypothetical protein
MGEERGFGTAQPVKPISGTLGLVSQSASPAAVTTSSIGVICSLDSSV